MLLTILKRSTLFAFILAPTMAFAIEPGGYTENCRFRSPDQDHACEARINVCPRRMDVADNASPVAPICINSLMIRCGSTDVFSGPFTSESSPGMIEYRAGSPAQLGAPSISHAWGVELPANLESVLQLGRSHLHGICHVALDDSAVN